MNWSGKLLSPFISAPVQNMQKKMAFKVHFSLYFRKILSNKGTLLQKKKIKFVKWQKRDKPISDQIRAGHGVVK